jgi:hypothetical protein
MERSAEAEWEWNSAPFLAKQRPLDKVLRILRIIDVSMYKWVAAARRIEFCRETSERHN